HSWSVPETNCSFEQYIKNPPSPIPLDFIAQINMADLQSFEAAAELHQSGMLYFFYLSFCGPSGFDPTDRGGFKVIFYDGPMDLLRRREPPEGCFKDYAPCALKFDERWTLSNTLELPEPDATVYHDFYFDSSFSEAGDQILGQPYTLQGAMELQCQLTSNGCNTGDATGYSAENLERFGAGERDWRLLLQIDCSDEADWTWGCGDGLVYFWIRKQDLLALNFNDVWLHMQCS
ncbi:MAG: DUF1963 domain-containing protein, partial [Cyanobacteria bacterium SZAS LIN-2]|nr:DUF1963 domain-containing protein [Cyanobacteria bacterium SZAS LIN-2]